MQSAHTHRNTFTNVTNQFRPSLLNQIHILHVQVSQSLVYSCNVIQYGQKNFLFHCYSNAFIGAASCATECAVAAATADDDDEDSAMNERKKKNVTLKRISNGNAGPLHYPQISEWIVCVHTISHHSKKVVKLTHQQSQTQTYKFTMANQIEITRRRRGSASENGREWVNECMDDRDDGSSELSMGFVVPAWPIQRVTGEWYWRTWYLEKPSKINEFATYECSSGE